MPPKKGILITPECDRCEQPIRRRPRRQVDVFEVTGPKANGGGAWTERFSWNGFDKAVGAMLKEVAKRRPQP